VKGRSVNLFDAHPKVSSFNCLFVLLLPEDHFGFMPSGPNLGIVKPFPQIIRFIGYDPSLDFRRLYIRVWVPTKWIRGLCPLLPLIKQRSIFRHVALRAGGHQVCNVINASPRTGNDVIDMKTSLFLWRSFYIGVRQLRSAIEATAIRQPPDGFSRSSRLAAKRQAAHMSCSPIIFLPVHVSAASSRASVMARSSTFHALNRSSCVATSGSPSSKPSSHAQPSSIF